MHELGQQYAVCIGVNPGDQDANGRHGCSKRNEKRKPGRPMRGGGPKVIGHRQMPNRPENTQYEARCQCVLLQA